MATTNHDSGLGEALASYQPKLLEPAVWDRFRDDAIALVVQLQHASTNRAIQRLSALCAFLADVVPGRPETDLAGLLSREDVDGFLARATTRGVARSTVDNYRAALNALLKVKEGRVHRQPARRKVKPHLAPYGEAELIRLLAAGAADATSGGAALARTLGCVLAGVGLPGDGQTLQVDVTDTVITVAGRVWCAPAGLVLPASGPVDSDTVACGRAWAGKELEVRLDLRRLELTAITALVTEGSAVEVLRLPGLGRDRLTAAVKAAGRPTNARVKELLRG